MSKLLRYLHIAFSAVCGLVAVLLVVLWIRSVYKLDLYYSISDTRHIELWSFKNKVCINTGAVKTFLPTGDTVGRKRMRDAHDAMMAADLEIWRETGNPPMPETNSFGFKWHGWSTLVMPYWFPVLVTTILAALPWIRWRFSLRTLLIATTLIGLILGLIIATTR